MSTPAITVKCPACSGARTLVFDHAAGRVDGYCPRCQPDPMTSHLTPDVQALTAEVQRLRAENAGLRDTLKEAVEFFIEIDGKAADFGRLKFVARAQDEFGIAR